MTIFSRDRYHLHVLLIQECCSRNTGLRYFADSLRDVGIVVALFHNKRYFAHNSGKNRLRYLRRAVCLHYFLSTNGMRHYYWVCKQGHSFRASPSNRAKGTKCPYCTGKLPVVGVNDFGMVCSYVAAEWHPTQNGDRLPEHYLPNSHQEVFWKCKAGHEWKQKIYERANGSQCPYCQERKPVVGYSDLATQYPELAKHWDFSKNKKGPESYFPDGVTPVWWECEASHSFRASIREMVLRWRCPRCERRHSKP